MPQETHNPSSPAPQNYHRPRLTPPQYHPGLHYLALLTVITTFPLIFMGGLVTSHGAGLSVPDWPNSFGYNMFTFPPSRWVQGVLYEHTHRLAGTLVGLLSILLVIVAFLKDSRRSVRYLSLAVLAAVIVQGVLGGLRVVWVNLDLAIIHACVGQAFFCLTALMAALTSKWWLQADTPAPASSSSYRSVFRAAAITVALIYAQLIVGAIMRHYRAGLAIPDLPLNYNHLLPPTNQDALAAANLWRSTQPGLFPVTLTQIWVHFAHRLGAIPVTIAIGYLVHLIARHHRNQPLLMRPAWALTLLLFLQLLLGVMVVLLKKPADITSSHVAVGALILLTTFVIAIRARRLGHATTVAAAPKPQQQFPSPSTSNPLTA